MDRFARNTREALGIIEPLLDSEVTIKVLNLGTIENNYREGRPKSTLNKQKLHAFELLQSGKSYREVALMTGFSKSTLQRIKKLALMHDKDDFN